MSRSWYVVKYVGDLMRDEPRNVGVIVHDGSETRLRFAGQRPDGSVDGRRVQWLNSVENYKLWVKHWQRLVETSGPSALESEARRGADNYFLSPQAQEWYGQAPNSLDDLTERLFATLVAEETELAETLRDRVQLAFKHLSLEADVTPNTEIAVEVGGAVDMLHFDYLYEKNKRMHLMELVNLDTADRRSWDKVHAASWMFERLRDATSAPELAQARCIALVRSGPTDRKQQRDQLKVLERSSDVVDFASSAADDELGLLVSA